MRIGIISYSVTIDTLVTEIPENVFDLICYSVRGLKKQLGETGCQRLNSTVIAFWSCAYLQKASFCHHCSFANFLDSVPIHAAEAWLTRFQKSIIYYANTVYPRSQEERSVAIFQSIIKATFPIIEQKPFFVKTYNIIMSVNARMSISAH